MWNLRWPQFSWGQVQRLNACRWLIRLCLSQPLSPSPYRRYHTGSSCRGHSGSRMHLLSWHLAVEAEVWWSRPRIMWQDALGEPWQLNFLDLFGFKWIQQVKRQNQDQNIVTTFRISANFTFDASSGLLSGWYLSSRVKFLSPSLKAKNCVILWYCMELR